MSFGSFNSIITIEINPTHNQQNKIYGGTFSEYHQKIGLKTKSLNGDGSEGVHRRSWKGGFTLGVMVGLGGALALVGATAYTVYTTVTAPVLAVPAAKLSFGTSMAMIKGLAAKGAIASAL